MYKKLILQAVLVIAVCVGIWYGFSQLSLFKQKIEPSLSLENEEKLGDELFDFYIKEEDQIADILVDSTLGIIIGRLLHANGNTKYDYKFAIVQEDQINAFALPGGRIVIYSGLIELTDSPEELAAVLAHEIGHVEKQHVTKKLVKELGLTLVLSVLTGADATLLSELLRTLTSTAFDRKQEKEADNFGLELLEKANINPSTFAVIFRKMDREQSWNKNMELIATHPHNSSRIENALTYKTKDGFKAAPIIVGDWKAVKEQLKEGKQNIIKRPRA